VGTSLFRYESELLQWRSGNEVGVDQQKPLNFSTSSSAALGLDISMDTRGTRGQPPSSRGCSPGLQQDTEERARMNSIIEEKVKGGQLSG